ncbi:hypothetical protein HRbin41_01015 [bacterium HR41]|nr:hypothetical protein HRbin41_01015 [bacterium HR41]
MASFLLRPVLLATRSISCSLFMGSRRLVWSVTPVRAGRFRLRWSLAPSLYGRAVAVDRRTGRRPAGEFVVRVSDRAPRVRVADDGRTIVAR